MADIQFEEEQQYQRSPEPESKSLLIRLVLATSIVSTDKAAEYVLVGVAAFLFILAFLIPSFFGGSSARPSQSVINAAMQLPPSY